MLTEHPNFKVAEEFYYATGALNRICVQYVSDIADKFNQLHALYLKALVAMQ